MRCEPPFCLMRSQYALRRASVGNETLRDAKQAVSASEGERDISIGWQTPMWSVEGGGLCTGEDFSTEGCAFEGRESMWSSEDGSTHTHDSSMRAREAVNAVQASKGPRRRNLMSWGIRRMEQ